MKTPDSRPPVIGLLLDTFFESFEMEIWSGIKDFARQHEINLLCFVGGSDHPGEQEFSTLELIHPANVDGLIVLGRDQLPGLDPSIPVVTIGRELPGIDSVVVNENDGFRELINHLVDEHNYKKIAFIRGPENSAGDDARMELYKKVLEEHHISFKASLVVSGGSTPDEGEQAVTRLLEDRRITPEVIVAGNDQSAIGAIKALNRRGYRVPQDVAVVGFGDIQECKYLSQPLTTVNIPAYSLGQKGIEILLEKLKGSALSRHEILPSRIIIRRSCGCYMDRDLEDLSVSLVQKDRESPFNPDELKDDIIIDIYHCIDEFFNRFKNQDVKREWAEKMVNTLFDDLERLADWSFLGVLENIVTDAIIADIEVLTWQKVVIEVFKKVKIGVRNLNQEYFLKDLYKRSLDMIWEIAVRSLTYMKLKSEERDELLFSISQAFITVFDEERLREVIRHQLPRLGIREYFISLVDDSKKNARLIASAHRDDERGNSFLSVSLVPGGLKKESSFFAYILMPLYYKNDYLGFALFDSSAESGNVYESLVVQISSALKSIKLLGEVQRHADNLETTVKARTADLREANRRLKMEIEERRKTAEILRKKNDEIKRLNDQLRHKSRIDGLTRLYNREAFFELMEEEMARMRAQGDRRAVFSVILLDIDHFKKVNDTYGHLTGDIVLQALGLLFQEGGVLRAEDFAGRFGGEEFIILCPETGEEDTREIAHRLSEAFKVRRFTGGKDGFFVTLSIGITEATLEDQDCSSVIHRADVAMYHSKEQGRDRTTLYSEIS